MKLKQYIEFYNKEMQALKDHWANPTLSEYTPERKWLFQDKANKLWATLSKTDQTQALSLTTHIQ